MGFHEMGLLVSLRACNGGREPFLVLCLLSEHLSSVRRLGRFLDFNHKDVTGAPLLEPFSQRSQPTLMVVVSFKKSGNRYKQHGRDVVNLSEVWETDMGAVVALMFVFVKASHLFDGMSHRGLVQLLMGLLYAYKLSGLAVFQAYERNTTTLEVANVLCSYGTSVASLGVYPQLDCSEEGQLSDNDNVDSVNEYDGFAINNGPVPISDGVV